MPVLKKKEGLKFHLRKLEREEPIKPKESRIKKIINRFRNQRNEKTKNSREKQ